MKFLLLICTLFLAGCSGFVQQDLSKVFPVGSFATAELTVGANKITAKNLVNTGQAVTFTDLDICYYNLIGKVAELKLTGQPAAPAK